MGTTRRGAVAHQDQGLTDRAAPRLLAGYADLHKAMLATVTGARECLAVIEAVLAERPSLVYYCVLFGPPHHQVLKDHLLALLRLHDPHDRRLGVKTLHVGLVEDTTTAPERFFCANEQMAVAPIPSLTSHEAFDSGVVLGAAPAARLLEHGRQAYAASRRVETLEEVTALDVLREWSSQI